MYNYSYKKNKLEQLRGFCAVVECGTIVEAAKKLHLSESSISLQISSLEKDLKVKLFDKVGRNLKINTYGKAYYLKAKEVLNKVEDIYNEELSLKISKVEIWKMKMKNILLAYNNLIYKKYKRFAMMFIKIQYLIIFIITFFCATDYLSEKSLVDGFERGNAEITKNVAGSILQIESQMEKVLENAAITFGYEVEKNPKMDMKKLKDVCLLLNVDNCGIQDANGVVISSSRKDVNLPKNQEYYKTHSIADQIKNFEKIKLEDRKFMPSSFYGTFGDSDNLEPRIVKGIDYWNKKLNRILYMKIRSKNIISILKKYVAENDNIKSIYFISPSGKIIASTDGNYQSLSMIHKYINKPLVAKNTVILSFGGMQDELWTHKSEIEAGLTNNNGEYFYTLKTVFNEQELNKKITYIRILLGTVATFILSVIYIFRRAKGENKR